MGARLARLRERMEGADRLRLSLGYTETLRRGFAVVRGDGALVTTAAAARRARALEIEFADGRLALDRPQARRGGDGGGEQGSLF